MSRSHSISGLDPLGGGGIQRSWPWEVVRAAVSVDSREVVDYVDPGTPDTDNSSSATAESTARVHWLQPTSDQVLTAVYSLAPWQIPSDPMSDLGSGLPTGPLDPDWTTVGLTEYLGGSGGPGAMAITPGPVSGYTAALTSPAITGGDRPLEWFGYAKYNAFGFTFAVAACALLRNASHRRAPSYTWAVAKRDQDVTGTVPWGSWTLTDIPVLKAGVTCVCSGSSSYVFTSTSPAFTRTRYIDYELRLEFT